VDYLDLRRPLPLNWPFLLEACPVLFQRAARQGSLLLLPLRETVFVPQWAGAPPLPLSAAHHLLAAATDQVILSHKFTITTCSVV
jgi:hypothetical protein